MAGRLLRDTYESKLANTSNGSQESEDDLLDIAFKLTRFEDTALMLSAMAIECLLKAVLVEGGANVVSEDGKRFRPENNHKHCLDCWAREIFGKMAPEDEDLLRRLTPYNEIGRYPISTRDNKGAFRSLTKKEKAELAEAMPGPEVEQMKTFARGWSYPTDYEAMDVIIENLRSGEKL